MDRDKRFEELREGLYQELLKANMHFKTFWVIRKASEDIADIRNVYLTFFFFTMRSHNDRFCIAIYNAVKFDDDTANFQKLFNYIRSSKVLSQIFTKNEIEQMEKKILSHQELINRLKNIRDQYIAHNQITKKHLSEKTTYKYEEGKRLLIDLNDILQEVSHKYDRGGYWHDEENLLDVNPSLNVENMLRDLTEYRNEQIKKIRQGATN